MIYRSKYKSRKVMRDGQVFDSLLEYRRWRELLLLERAGKIQDLKRQVSFELIPAQYEEIPTGEFYVRGERKGQEKIKRVCVEQSVCYVADFVYTEGGKQIVEDTKGFETKDFIIKRKLLLWVHGIKLKITKE
jgi:hypothetical protein